ncbi:MAG: 30S ribosome-binding factor RbfA [Planctomycetes bacterium]|jgi:ribosome-binding factor A|nr:30S ribosome-binding factor RbfA [Planctomycetota bacterium]
MSRRTERVGSQIKRIIGRLMLAKMADPRLDPALTSVTRVEVPEDLMTATVYVSITHADEKQERTTLAALRHARGYIQEAIGDQIRMRHTPVLEFKIDRRFKKTMETLNLISEVMDEIHQKEQAKADGSDADDASGPAQDTHR